MRRDFCKPIGLPSPSISAFFQIPILRKNVDKWRMKNVCSEEVTDVCFNGALSDSDLYF